MNDNVIPFRRTLPPIVWSDGRVQSGCDDQVHMFESVPGRCQCGEKLWEKTPVRISFGFEQEDTSP